jgi:hypothetical protein
LILQELQYMSQSPNDQNDVADKKKQQDKDSSLNQKKESASPDEKNEEAKSKSYAEILKGFQEIEKIFKRDQQKS